MKQTLIGIVNELMAPGKGILAADESANTVEKRFKPINLENTEDHRRAFRELFFTAPRLNKYISGVILFDETIRQKSSTRESFVSILQKQGVVPGIKVDLGTEAMAASPGEKVTKGLEGLPERLGEYAALGAQFAKWRAVITIGPGLPTEANIQENTLTLARYAAACQEAGIVPIVEPEVLMEGDHSIERCQEVTTQVQKRLFANLANESVMIEGLLLKSNMVIAGSLAPWQGTVSEVAEKTIHTFKATVPSTIGGIVFLSGGQSERQATEHLNEMFKQGPLPWRLTFSYARALQDSATKMWRGKSVNMRAAQDIFIHRARMNSLATQGQYRPDLEIAGVEGFERAQASQD